MERTGACNNYSYFYCIYITLYLYKLQFVCVCVCVRARVCVCVCMCVCVLVLYRRLNYWSDFHQIWCSNRSCTRNSQRQLKTNGRWQITEIHIFPTLFLKFHTCVLTRRGNLTAGVWDLNLYLSGCYYRFLTEIHIFQPFELKFDTCILICIRNPMAGVLYPNSYLNGY